MAMIGNESTLGQPHIPVRTKFLRLFHPIAVGEHVGGWRVCWVGGWDRSHILFIVMVEASQNGPGRETPR